MSKADILAELPKLTLGERREILQKIIELQGDEWLDEGGLSDQEKALIEQRLAAHAVNPESVVPWEEVRARLDQKFEQ